MIVIAQLPVPVYYYQTTSSLIIVNLPQVKKALSSNTNQRPSIVQESFIQP